MGREELETISCDDCGFTFDRRGLRWEDYSDCDGGYTCYNCMMKELEELKPYSKPINK